MAGVGTLTDDNVHIDSPNIIDSYQLRHSILAMKIWDVAGGSVLRDRRMWVGDETGGG